MTGRLFFRFALIAVLSLACNFATRALKQIISPTNLPPGPISEEQPFSKITFCQDVTDDGKVIGAMEKFPGGTKRVWAYFTYSHMQKGTTWGRLWEKDGKVYNEARGKTWEEGESGWVAYSISESGDVPLSGRYSLTLYIGESPAQRGTFEVATPEGASSPGTPSFGPIQFAKDMTGDRVPVGEAKQFEAGVTRVYAIFPYNNIAATQAWKYTWLFNGAVTAQSETSEWGGRSDGVTYLYIYNDQGLAPGTYTLNLYFGEQVARSGSFEVLIASATATALAGPAKPEELIDPDLMPAWQILYDAQDQYDFLHNTAQFALDHRIPIRMDESYDGSTVAYYSKDNDACQPTYKPGFVAVHRQSWNQSSWEKLAGVLAHELTHAMQHYEDKDYRCPGCSVFKEYHAFIAEYYTYMMIGRSDLIPSSLYDSDGRFNADLLWNVIKQAYGGSCPDY